MVEGETFQISYYAKKHSKFITRNGKWDNKIGCYSFFKKFLLFFQHAYCRNRKIVGLLTKEAFTSSISATHFLKEIYIWVVSDDNSRGKSQDAFSFSIRVVFLLTYF